MTRRGAGKLWRTMLLGMAALLLPASVYASTTTLTISGGEQRAGNGNWDAGSLTLTVDGHTETISFGQFSTVQSVASGLAAKFSQDCNSPVQAHAIGAVIAFTTKQPDVSFEQISASPVWDTADFAQASFGIAQPQGTTTTLTTYLTLSCTPNPVPAGASIDCTSRVIEGATGTVTFNIGTQAAWSTANVDGDGWAPASTLSGLQTGGPYTVTASYSGDSHYNPTSNNISVTVDSGSLVSSTVYSYTITPTGGPSGYAPNDNILAYTDSVNGTWNMGASGYDNLKRLVSASVVPSSSNTTSPPPPYWCWAYDSFGNRTVEATSSSTLSGSACPTNSSPTVQASFHSFGDGTNHITGDPQIQYDAAGNTTVDHDNSYLYDGDGRVCAVNNGVIMTQYIYGADGNRVAKGTIQTWSCDTTQNQFNPTTSYVLGQGGEQVTEMSINSGQATWAHTNVYAGDSLIATYDPLGLHFQLADWLGNRRVQTNAFGQVEETCINSPYGNGLVCSSPTGAPTTADDATEHHFTGKERDAESGNDHFWARYYSGSVGRWPSPDPSGLTYADPTNPQSLNLYSYVTNNPLGNIDPLGLAVTCVTTTTTTVEQTPISGIDGTYMMSVRKTQTSSVQCHDDGKLIKMSEMLSKPVRPAPSNAPKKPVGYWTKVACNLSAEKSIIKKDGVGLALDAAGFIPFEKVPLAIATTLGGIGSAFNSIYHGDVTGTALGVGSEATGLAHGAFLATEIGGAWMKAIPYVGTGLNVISTAHDLSNARSDGFQPWAACIAARHE